VRGLDEVEREVLSLCRRGGGARHDQAPTLAQHAAGERLIQRGPLRVTLCPRCGGHLVATRTKLAAHIEELDRMARSGSLVG
jgi:hypothetical protein